MKASTVDAIWLDLVEAGLANETTDEDGSTVYVPNSGVSVDLIENKPYPNKPHGLLELVLSYQN